MKHLRVLPLVLFPLCLSSCGNDSYAGTYAFQLGKTSGTHFGVSAVVSEENYIENAGTAEEKVVGKKINLAFNMGGFTSGTILDELSITSINIPAYYNIGKDLENGFHEIKIGFNLDDIIKENVEDYDEKLFPDITPSQTEKIVYTTISSSAMKLAIPVSMNDLYFQLYWYGLDIYETGSGQDIREVEAHETGTHPTAEQVKAINDAGYASEHNGTNYRDFHNLTLQLSKQ